MNNEQLIDIQFDREVAIIEAATQTAMDRMTTLTSAGGDAVLGPVLRQLVDVCEVIHAHIYESERMQDYHKLVMLITKEQLAATIYQELIRIAATDEDTGVPTYKIKENTLASRLGYAIEQQVRFNVIEQTRRGIKKPFDKLPLITVAKANEARASKLSHLKKDAAALLELKTESNVRISTGVYVLAQIEETLSTIMHRVFDHAKNNQVVASWRLRTEIQEAMEFEFLENVATRASLGFMVCPPMPLEKGKLSIRHRYISEVGAPRGDVMRDPSAEALETANRIQAQPFAINMKAFQWLATFDQPITDQLVGVKPLPSKPGRDETDKQFARRIARLNMSNAAKRQLVNDLVAACSEACAYEAIYFPTYFDFRGRIYSAAYKGLGPQTTKTAKALLISGTKGRELGTDGLWWLYHELGNAMGYDKDLLADKVAKAEALTPRMADIVANPMSDKVWLDTEEPLKVLTIMDDIVNALASGNPETYKSRCFVYVDGTCNGMQHLSLLMRDEVGATATNVIGTEASREDFYATVGERFMDIISDDTSDAAMYWKDMGVKGTDMGNNQVAPGIRKIVKRGCMTIPYGATFNGLGEQVIEDGFCSTSDRRDQRTQDQAVKFRETLWAAMGGAAPKAMAVRDSLIEAVKVIVKSGKQPTWIAHSGSTIYPDYRERRSVQVKLGGTKRTWIPDYNDNAGKPKIHQHTNAIVANLIHSYDAAMLQLTALRMGDAELSFVHDSYGCLPGDMTKLSTELRSVAVEMYSGDTLGDLWAHLQTLTETELPAPPSLGELKVEDVHTAPYFFS